MNYSLDQHQHRFAAWASARAAQPRFASVPELVAALEPLPGVRNIVIHEYVELDYDRVLEALRRLDPIERFGTIVARLESSGGD